MTHICVNEWIIIGLGVRRQAITYTNAVVLSIGVLETNFNEIWIEILSFSFQKMY